MKYNPYHIFFTKLANPLKIEIIFALMKKNKTVSELIKEIDTEQSKISHALISLKECNIVKVEQKGKQRIYSLNKNVILPILKTINQHVLKHCKKRCNALK